MNANENVPFPPPPMRVVSHAAVADNEMGGMQNYRAFSALVGLGQPTAGWGLLLCLGEDGETRYTRIAYNAETVRAMACRGDVAGQPISPTTFTACRTGWPDDWVNAAAAQ
jgi:hypothetical protein